MWRFPVGVDIFSNLVDPKKNYLFVDKTDFIQRVFDDGSETLVITRPRRWGKSLTLSMLQHFLAEVAYGIKTAPLFQTTYWRNGQQQGLKIATMDNGAFLREHQGQYPVIFISLKDVKEATFESAVTKLKIIISELYSEYTALYESPHLTTAEQTLFAKICNQNPEVLSENYEQALRTLSKLLFKHYGKKAWILIDEYDTPLNTAYGDTEYLDNLTRFMKNLLSAALKSNPYLEKGVLTGVLRVSKEAILSGLNNFRVYSLLSDQLYSQDLGFTEKEVSELFTEAELTQGMIAVKKWYNGYTIGDYTIYNPWSIINCLASKGLLLPYWINTADDKLLTDALLHASIDIKKQFERLAQLNQNIPATINESIRFEAIQRDPNALWSMLYSTGYLTGKLEPERLSYVGTLRIPNEEIRCLYLGTFSLWLNQIFNGKTIPLVTALIQGDISRFAQFLEHYLLAHASSRNLHYEGSYHNLVLGLMAQLMDTHFVFSDQLEAGEGYSDMVIIPREKQHSAQAILLEFKHLRAHEQAQDAAYQALQQIKERQYIVLFTQYPYIHKVVLVGMAFVEKTVSFVQETQIL